MLLAVIILVAPKISVALDLNLQPRFNTGAQYYEYSQDAFSFASLNPRFANTGAELKFSDVVPFVSGGLTLFVDRFFVDFSVQYSFEGNDEDNFSSSSFLPASGFIPTDTVARTSSVLDTDFNRIEFAVSAGYAVTDQLVIFAGYKNAETNFRSRLKAGKIDTFSAANLVTNPFLSGTLTGKLDPHLEYDGPFVGGAYTWKLGMGPVQGTLTGNLAVAFMDGSAELKFRDIVVTNQLGQQSPLDVNAVINTTGLSGDTIGLSVGLTWKGFTPLDGFTYTVGVNGYRYDFNGADTPDFTETVVRFDIGVAYLF